MSKRNVKKNLRSIIFDFDGVLTNNKVYLDENGIETVICNRADGLAFNILKKLNISLFIVSSEKNKIVKVRGNKLKVTTYHNCRDKALLLKKLSNKKMINLNSTMFVGNDINDFAAMMMCKFRVCPNDASIHIKQISNYILKINGGEGVARYLVEDK